MNSKIIIYGNFFVDHIYHLNESIKNDQNNNVKFMDKAYGGVINFYKPLKEEAHDFTISFTLGNDETGKFFKRKTKKNFQIKFKKGRTSQANIFIDKRDSTRTSFAEKGISNTHNVINFHKSDWFHVSYLDLLSNLNLEKLKHIQGKANIMSCDLGLNCSTSQEINLIKKKLKFFNYLIISNHELRCYFPSDSTLESIKASKKYVPEIIVHSAEKIWINEDCIINNKIYKNINPLGAGDFFCAKFIVNMLNSNNNKFLSASYANKTTRNFLKKKYGS